MMKIHPDDFLVLYDYGQGDVWAIVSARSEREIKARFPDFEVFDRPPKWMSEDDLSRLNAQMKFDIDRPSGWLAKVERAQRSRRGDVAAG